MGVPRRGAWGVNLEIGVLLQLRDYTIHEVVNSAPACCRLALYSVVCAGFLFVVYVWRRGGVAALAMLTSVKGNWNHQYRIFIVIGGLIPRTIKGQMSRLWGE